nr:MAG TPA: tail completion protein [Caudoviricetes sp.]
MGIEQIEKAFIAWLNNVIPDLPAESFPDDPERYDLLHEGGVVLVRYNGTTFAEPETLGLTTQSGETEFVLSVLAFSLTDPNGIYALLTKVLRAICGKSFNGSTPVKIKNVAFAGVNINRWQYDITASFDLPIVEAAEAEPFSLIKHLTIRNAHDKIHL